jgi:hypothetical protein
MKRIFTVFAVVALMAVMVVAMSAPAFASRSHEGPAGDGSSSDHAGKSLNSKEKVCYKGESSFVVAC